MITFVCIFIWQLQVISAVRWLLHFEIFSLVPLEGSISYHELSSVANVPENLLRSHIRLAMTCHLFQESGPIGMVAHSSVSRQLASDPSLVSWGQYFANSVFPTATKNVNATAAWPGSKELNETAHNLAFDHHGSFFDYVSQDPARTVEFANSMKAVSTTSFFDPCHLCKSFDWSSLGDGVVVDVSLYTLYSLRAHYLTTTSRWAALRAMSVLLSQRAFRACALWCKISRT